MEASQIELLRYENSKKSIFVAYLFWLLLGIAGAHRIYLGRYISGVLLFISFLSNILIFLSSDGVIVAIILDVIAGLWILVDLFLIPGMVSNYNNYLLSGIKSRSTALSFLTADDGMSDIARRLLVVGFFGLQIVFFVIFVGARRPF